MEEEKSCDWTGSFIVRITIIVIFCRLWLSVQMCRTTGLHVFSVGRCDSNVNEAAWTEASSAAAHSAVTLNQWK